MAKYKKRKDGRYQTSIVVGTKPNGKPNRKYIYAKTTTELELKLAENKVMHSKGVDISNSSMSFKELGELWFKLTKENKEYNTRISVRRILQLHIYPTLGHLNIKNIKAYHIQDLVNTLIAKGFTDTTRKTLQYIKAILELGVHNDFLLKNVAKSIKLPTFKSTPKKILNKFERDIIENVAKIHKHGDMILTFMFTGMRREELMPLQKTDVDFKKMHLKIDKAINFIHNQAVIKTTKNKDSRNIPLTNKISEILERRCNQAENNYLFPMSNGKMMSETSFSEAIESFRNACNKYIDELNAQVKNEEDKHEHIHFTAYTFRHTFCTFLYYSGIGIKEAQEIMGHHSAKMTLDIYTHLDAEQSKNVTSKLNNYFDNF